ncbi:hypothetical protein HUJ04_011569 [Dendroctonus ponderosae]|nr:hypothetical protein HUJ04_011569 [Dendroctonus ponderosae]
MWDYFDFFRHVAKLPEGSSLIIGLAVTVGAIPAVVFLIFAEVIVDYCGHSNILIFCFVNYICHHLTLICIENATLLFLCEFLEIFTLHVMYVTAVLYLRHLVPRKLTACGQALPVVAHFCLGRCIGAFLGGIAYDEYPANFNRVHQWFTVAAAVVAFIYYIAYHFYLKPKCGAPVHLPPDPAPAVVQSNVFGTWKKYSINPAVRRTWHEAIPSIKRNLFFESLNAGIRVNRSTEPEIKAEIRTSSHWRK